MKKILYIVFAVSGLLSLGSCGRFEDENGNPLVDNGGHVEDPRALFREYTDADNIAEYRYTGLLLTEVIGPLHKTRDNTKIVYSGTKIASVLFNGKKGTDSISYTQNFTYGAGDHIDKVTESRMVYDLSANPPLNNLPAPKIYKTQYDMKYSTTGPNRLSEILMRTRLEVPGGSTNFTDYSKSLYTYDGSNVTKVVKGYSTVTNGTTLEPLVNTYTYEYNEYDNKIAPTTLLPFGYNLSRILANDAYLQTPPTPGAPLAVNLFHYIFSSNNPEKIKVSETGGGSFNAGTDYVYDSQNFMTRGFNVYYVYKPM